MSSACWCARSRPCVATSDGVIVLDNCEWVYAVPGLSVSDDGGGDAVSLFVERARAAGGTRRLDRLQVANLCRALDGMALAIELAAARYPSLGLDGLMAGRDQRLRFLTTGARAGDRHRSLRDALAWSYELLRMKTGICSAPCRPSPHGSTSTPPVP